MSSGSESRRSAEGYWGAENFVVNPNRVIVLVSEVPDVENQMGLDDFRKKGLEGRRCTRNIWKGGLSISYSC